MNAKDECKAKLEMLFEAALMEAPEQPGPAKAVKTPDPASSPALERSLPEARAGAASPFGAKSVFPPSFVGIKA